MHPEVTSDDPNATCEKCGGMKLMKRESAPAATPAGAAPAPAAAAHGGAVHGLVPIQLTPERIQLMGMRTAPATRARLGSELRTVGFVQPNEGGIAMIHTRFSGWIEELQVAQTGQEVKKGQVVATVYSPDLLAAQQELLNALRWSSAGSQSADSERLSATLAQDARRRLELLGVSSQEIDAIVKSGKPMRAVSLRSPVSGYVTEKNALQGQFVTPDTTLFTVADLSTVWVVADAYEYEVSRVRKGQAARLQLAAYANKTFTGKVQYVYPTLDAATRTLKIRIEFKNPGLALRPGMFGDVFLDTAAAEGLVVPSEAVVDTGDARYVFVAQGGGRFEPRAVAVGARGDGKVQVLSGLKEGEQVVTTANFLVDSESRLRAAIEGFGEQGAAAAGHQGH
jgi:Cu(I)/Ag(I) efflux system membrane fusion protein